MSSRSPRSTRKRAVNYFERSSSEEEEDSEDFTAGVPWQTRRARREDEDAKKETHVLSSSSSDDDDDDDDARGQPRGNAKKKRKKTLQKKSAREFENMLLQSAEKTRGFGTSVREKMRRKREKMEKQRKFLNASARASEEDLGEEGEEEEEEDAGGISGRGRKRKARNSNERRKGKVFDDSSDSEPTAAMKRVQAVPERSPPRYARRKAAPAVFKDVSSDEEAFFVTSSEEEEEDDDDDESYDSDDSERRRKNKMKSSNKKKNKSHEIEEEMRAEETYKIEKLLGCRKSCSEEGASGEMEYLVKWSYYSYRDVEWMLASELNKMGESSKVNAYRRKYGTAPSPDPDDLFPSEYLEIERIFATKETEEWVEYEDDDDDVVKQEDNESEVEIIDDDENDEKKKNTTTKVEMVRYYYCKWKSLNYSSATWEPESSLTSEEDLKEVARFMAYSDPSPPDTSALQKECEHLLKTRDKFKDTTGSLDPTIPEFKNGMRLREYQEASFRWMVTNFYKKKNVILGDEMGLGKTAQTIAVLEYARRYKYKYRPSFCVVAPLSTLTHWRREIEKWTDMNAIIFNGNVDDRDKCEKYEFWLNKEAGEVKFDVLLISYEIILKHGETALKDFTFEALVVDEGHRLKNIENATTRSILSMHYDWLLMLTGTPIQNNVKELFGLMHVLAPEIYPDWETFVETFGLDPAHAASIHHQPTAEQVIAIREALKPRMLRRLKDDVEKIPAKEEIVVRVELSAQQRGYYTAVAEKNIGVLLEGAKSKNTPQLRNICMELRKVCNHPFLCDGLEDDYIERRRSALKEGEEMPSQLDLLTQSSGKMNFLGKLLSKLKRDGSKVLIFSQFKRVLDILQDYLFLLKLPCERLDGDSAVQQRQEGIDRFNDPEQDSFAFLLSTRAGGVGITLTAADTAIIFDSDWNPQNDLQAMARCHRIGQTKEVKVYRLITNGTYEYELFQSASRKAALDEVLIGGGGADMDDDDDEDYGGYASYDEDGENRRVNGGQKTKKKKNEAERITALLQKGLQFARMGESANEESKRFEDEDIDTILTKRADVKTIGPKKGNAFSTFTFDAREEEDKKKFGDDVDPAEYWKTMFPEAARKAEEEKKNRATIDESLIVYGRRNRVSTISENLNLSLLEGGRSRGREKRDVTYDPSSEKERRPDGRGKNCWTTREIKIVYDSIFTYGCPYEDTRRVVFSREVREGIAEVSGRSEQDIKAVARSLLGIFDVLRKDSSVTAQTLANTDSLFTNAFPRSENLLADVKKAFENRQSRLFERKNLADLFEKTRTDEDYVWKADELPTLKNEEEISDVSMLKAQTWYSELLLPTRSWTVQHDLALLRGSLEIGFTPWNFAKSSEQFEAIYHEKQIGNIFVDASAAHDASRHSPSQYPPGLHPQLSSSSPPPPPPPPTTTTTTPMELEEFKNFARTRLPFLLSRISGLKTTNTRNVHSSFGGTSNLGAAQKLQWTHELKEKLYSALEELMTTHKRITPKNLWDEMRVTELTRDHIASYLQRVRNNEVNRPDLFSRLQQYEQNFFDQQQNRQRNEVQWTHELKEKLYSALEELMTTHKRITPKNLWDEMRVTELTRDHIASYLQRVRNNEVNRPDLFSRLQLHEFDQQNRNSRQTFLNKFGDSDGVVKEKPEKKYAPIRLAATRLWYAEEELKKLSRKNSRSLDEMETDHYRKKQDLLVMQDAEVKAKIQCGISDEYLGALQRANQMNMAQFSANLDMERESFMKNAREEEELLRINIKQRETELKEATEKEEQEKEVIKETEEEKAEVIELISDDDDDDDDDDDK